MLVSFIIEPLSSKPPPKRNLDLFLFGLKVVPGTGMLLGLRLVEPGSSGSPWPRLQGFVPRAWDCGEAHMVQ